MESWIQFESIVGRINSHYQFWNADTELFFFDRFFLSRLNQQRDHDFTATWDVIPLVVDMCGKWNAYVAIYWVVFQLNTLIWHRSYLFTQTISSHSIEMNRIE